MVEYLLISVHGSKSSVVRSLATLFGDVRDFLRRAIGKITGVSVARHDVGGDDGFCGGNVFGCSEWILGFLEDSVVGRKG